MDWGASACATLHVINSILPLEGFDWHLLLETFCGLGGIADNVCQGEGPLGRGIFPLKPSLPSTIFVPESLLVPLRDICLDSGAVKLKSSAPFAADFKQFFEVYQANFSWGHGGRLAIDGFERSLVELPASVLQKLAQHNLLHLNVRQRGAWDQLLFTRFLASRKVSFKGQPVIAPLWELVNHDWASPPFRLLHTGLSTPTMPLRDAELTFKYSESSPLVRLFDYGFTCPETTAFSFPFQLDIQTGAFAIHCDGRPLVDDRINLAQANGAFLLSGLPIGNSSVPEQPYAYLREVLKRLGAGQEAESLFQSIHQINIRQRQDLLLLLQDCDGIAADLIKAAVIFELELIAKSSL